jgi:bacterioferritin-associated ferredoxin
MIVCSCNVLSDKQILSAVANAYLRPPTMSQVYASLGCRARCGSCVPTIKTIRDEAFACAKRQLPNDLVPMAV